MNFQSQCEILIFLLVIFGYELKSETSEPETPDKSRDSYLSTTKIICKYGYPAESHEVKTKDGYILQLHRIPHGKNKRNARKNFPVFIQHGFQGTSAAFVVLGPENSLAFLLADAGHDVWLGNFRGNIYSRAHVSFKPTERAFWNFSWHEHGVYDLPASIDYISKHTGIEKLIYIGYSMGTTSFFVMASERPEYQHKIQDAILLAVSAFLEHMKIPLKLVGIVVDFFPPFDVFMNRELGSRSILRNLITRIFCSRPKFMNICVALTEIAVGYNPKGWPGDLSENIFSHTGGGTSIKTFVHFCQIISSGKFKQFDYKFWGNKIHYGRLKPPEYNISKAFTKLHIFEGHNDRVSVPESIEIIKKKIKTIERIEYINHTLFNHVDFLYSKLAKTLLYEKIIQIVNEIENNSKDSLM